MNAWIGLTDYLIADMASLSSTGSSGRRLGGCAFSRTENLLATATKPPINAVALSASIPAICAGPHTVTTRKTRLSTEPGRATDQEDLYQYVYIEENQVQIKKK